MPFYEYFLLYRFSSQWRMQRQTRSTAILLLGAQVIAELESRTDASSK